MLEKLSLDDEKIAACLNAAYGLRVTEIEFLPLGYDSYAGVYRVRSRGQDYFLKAKRDPVDDLSLSIPRYLKAQGIEQVVAPLPTSTQQPYGRAERDLLALTYYRYARVIEDLGGFGDQVFFLEGSDESKQDAVDWCIRQFEPGGMVEAAHQYDALFFG